MIGRDSVSARTGICITNSQKLIKDTLIHALGTGNCRGLILPDDRSLSLHGRTTMSTFFTRRGPSCIFLTTTGINNVRTGGVCQTRFLCSGLVVRTGVVSDTCHRRIGGLLFLKSSYVCPGLYPRPVGRRCLLANFLRPAGRPCTVTGVTNLGLYRGCYHRCKIGFVSTVPAGLCNVGSGFRLTGSRILPTLVQGFRRTGIGNSPAIAI